MQDNVPPLTRQRQQSLGSNGERIPSSCVARLIAGLESDRKHLVEDERTHPCTWRTVSGFGLRCVQAIGLFFAAAAMVFFEFILIIWLASCDQGDIFDSVLRSREHLFHI